MSSPANTRPVNGVRQRPGTGAPRAGAVAARHASVQSPSSADRQDVDTQLQQAVRQAAVMRRGFYLVVLVVALAGQVSGAVQSLHIPLVWAVPAVAALELGGVVVLANADVRRRLGEHAIGSRVLSAVVAAGAVAFNWTAHPEPLLGGFFAGMSALGYLVWLTHAGNSRRDRLRAHGVLPPTTPAYEPVGHWMRHPWLTRRARSIAKAHPDLGLYASLHAARAELDAQRRRKAIAAVLHRKIRAAVDPTTADIAVAVYDLDVIAERLADSADYDGLTALIAHDLTPARLTPPTPHHADQHTAPARTTTAPPPAPQAGPATDSPDLTPASAQAAAADTIDSGAPASAEGEQPPTAVQAPPAPPTTQRTAPAVVHGNRQGHDRPPITTGPAATAGVPPDDTAAAAPVAGSSHPMTASAVRAQGQDAVQPELSTGLYAAASVERPRPGSEHHTSRDTLVKRHNEQDEDSDGDGAGRDRAGGHGGGDGGGDGDTVPQDTAAAVAYWYQREADPHPRDIAARIGRSERTVRRYWPQTDDINP
ncbi:hypothetical protein OHA72_10150 [Dactylosporangium sp. NBC_01737]|uniref:hypothetical protein n=1 Tax=Dactylosporangium sp. NBC_01737 TaxID=2975959 RepID=UPI002E0F1F0D|nr:hypothetical protein OHA72_10150 [Dactylosporangium sp. NBC_01737]